jgi:hypothetical protein
MIFSGLPAAVLGGLFFAGGACLVALYWLRLRRRAVAVPFSLLWDRIVRDRDTAALFSKLQRLLSLLLQLTLLGLLVLALGNPRWVERPHAGRTTVVLLDASASMQATDVSPNRLAVAKDKVKALVRAMDASDRMLVAQMDAMVTPLGPLTSDRSVLEQEVDAVKPTEMRADFARALRFAIDVLSDVEHREIVVVSDGALGPDADAYGSVALGGARLSYVKIGARGDNVGLTEFAVRRYPLNKSRYEVMLELTNTGPRAEDVELQLLGDGAVVELTRVHLSGGERLPRFYSELSGASRVLEARIERVDGSRDDLPVDDRAYALLPERKRATVLAVTVGNTYVQAALLLDEYLDVTVVPPAGYEAAVRTGHWDAILFDGVTPAEPPLANAVYLDPRGTAGPVAVGAALRSPGFDWVDRKHPVLSFVSLDDVNVSVAHRLVPRPGDRVLGTSGQDRVPLLVSGSRDGYRFVALGFDIRDSDFPLRISWPLFVIGCIDWFSGDVSQYISGYRTGDVWHVPVPAGAEQATLRGPGGLVEPVPVHDGYAVWLGERSGVYELTAGEVTTSIAGNLLDAAESAIAPLDHIVAGGTEAGAIPVPRPQTHREVWALLLVVALGLTAMEWATYHRRVTV